MKLIVSQRISWIAAVLLLVCGLPGVLHAQFSSNLQGTVSDATGAVIPGANLTLTNADTGVQQTTQSNAEGIFRFLRLAPGPYEVQTKAAGFTTHQVKVQLTTDQTLNLPVVLTVSAQSTSISVTDEAPVLDTAESRTQLTIDKAELDSLPLPGHDLLGLTTVAPGVTGLGVTGSGGNGQSNDNYASETQVTASANGRSSVGNAFIVDGLDITSDITPGVLNLVPNPDSIQEATVQVNTYTVDYGRASSIVEVLTTRSGTANYHFVGNEFYTANWLTARTEFQPRETTTMQPFHTNNLSATVGGPVPKLKQMFFFTAWEPLLALTQSPSTVTYEDPAFTTWAASRWPNSIGVKLLQQYPATNAATTGVSKTGAGLYPTTCGTAAAAYIPCNLNVIDTGVLSATNYRNALQYNIRVDKYWNKDRVYGNYYRTGLDTGGPSVRVDHGAPQHYLVRSFQTNETHTFNANTINEASFGVLRMEGLINPTGPFHVPIITLTTGWSTQLGVSKAHEDYVQHHYVWHEQLTHLYKAHSFELGYEGFHGDNLTYFGQWYSQPAFSFQTIADFVQDNVYSEGGVSYNLLTGKYAGLAGGSFQYTGNTTGIYAQDVWRTSKRLTITYGARWDNFGNPAPENGSISSNFFLGVGTSLQQQVANGYVKQVPKALNHAITVWSPRVGLSWDPTGQSHWLVRGGIGLYHDWLTLGNVQNEYGNPPSPTTLTFYSTTGVAPIYNVGNSDTYPFGFTYPTISAYGLNNQGGITGIQSGIGGNDANLGATNTLNYTATLERSLGTNLSVAVGYSGSHSYDLYSGFASRTTNANYGVDINTFPGSLIQNNGQFIRLNTSFGSIRYTQNGPTSSYNAFIGEVKGRFLHKGFVDASYTRSASYDDAGTYPTIQMQSGNWRQYWSLSNWDVPNRLSMQISYEVPGLHRGPKPVRMVTEGWRPSAITILQSGSPFTVLQTSAFAPVCSSGTASKGVCPAGTTVVGNTGGDYNADGNNSDLPNLPGYGYTIPSSRKAQLNGVFKVSDFGAPTFSATAPSEGNEGWNGYRNPGYANTDFAMTKATHVTEKATFSLRVEVFNLFNRASLGGISSTTTSSTFGKVSSQYNARFLQIGGRLEF